MSISSLSDKGQGPKDEYPLPLNEQKAPQAMIKGQQCLSFSIPNEDESQES